MRTLKVLLGLLLAASLSAQTSVYVATTGSDSTGNGLATAPWATISYASAHLILGPTGTVVHVAPGTYTGGVSTLKSGTATARIAFRSDTKWGAKIRSSGIPYIWINRGAYVDIDGFDVSGDGKEGILNYQSHTRITNNHVHDLGRADCGYYTGTDFGAGIDTAGSDDSPRVATDNDIVGNVVHDLTYGCAIPSGIAGQHGIYHAYGSGLIANNLVYRAQAYGIHLWHNPQSVNVVNNVSIYNKSSGFIVGGSGGGVPDNIYVANNIFANNLSYGARVASVVGVNVILQNNLFNANTLGATYLQHSANVIGSVQADPKFVNVSVWNVHLQAGSPAINAGVALTYLTYDADGASRLSSGAYDIGAYEYLAATTPTATPVATTPTVTRTATTTRTVTRTPTRTKTPTKHWWKTKTPTRTP